MSHGVVCARGDERDSFGCIGHGGDGASTLTIITGGFVTAFVDVMDAVSSSLFRDTCAPGHS